MKDYILHFSGLNLGLHKFEYKISADFFNVFDNFDFQNVSISVNLILEKQERMLILNFDIKGVIVTTCDRCLDNVDFPIQGNEQLIVKFGENQNEEGDILIISEHEHQLDLSKYLYDYIILMLPIRIVHPEDENGNSKCNPEIIKKIQNPSEHQTDPRWESLKKLISEN